MNSQRTGSFFKRYAAVFWSIAGFFAIGYLPTMLFKSPVMAMAAAACAVIPFGVRSRSRLRGALRGAGLGAVAGLAAYDTMVAVLAAGRAKLPATASSSMPASVPVVIRPPPVTWHIFLYVGATAAMCAVVAFIFAAQARRHRREIE